MQKAQKTLYEMHEMAKTKGRKFERVVASAGTVNIGELDENSQIQVQINPMRELAFAERRGTDQLRHSLRIPDSDQYALELRGEQNQVTSLYTKSNMPTSSNVPASQRVEDSMISALSSIDEHNLNSFHDSMAATLQQHSNPTSSQRNHRRGNTIGAGSRNKKLLSNSMMPGEGDIEI